MDGHLSNNVYRFRSTANIFTTPTFPCLNLKRIYVYLLSLLQGTVPVRGFVQQQKSGVDVQAYVEDVRCLALGVVQAGCMSLYFKHTPQNTCVVDAKEHPIMPAYAYIVSLH